MSLLRKIFGGRSFEDERDRAAKLFDEGDYGSAKLGFEKAAEKAPDDAQREAMQDRVDESLDGIAEQRIDQARQYLQGGDIDLARSELEGALETAVDEEVVAEVRELIDGLEQEEALEAVADEVEVTDADRIAAIAGTWVDEQDEEYADYGDAITDALLDLHAERWERARERLESLLDDAEEPRYLWFEVGRARVGAGADAEGVEAIETFLELMAPDEGGEARLGAHMLLARMADERDDVDGAVEEFEKAAEALDDDPRPLLELGRYLRAKERADEAIEVLELAEEQVGSTGWQVWQELGLAYADAKRDEEAIAKLEGVVAYMVARNHFDFPMLTAYTLAKLHEKAGNLQRAADMFRSLTKGSDRLNHHAYHHDAGRVLAELGLEEEARRMLKRAIVLVEERETALEEAEPEGDDDAEAIAKATEALGELRTEIEERLSTLEGTE